MTPGEEKSHTFLSCSNQQIQNLNEELAPGSSRTEVIKDLSTWQIAWQNLSLSNSCLWVSVGEWICVKGGGWTLKCQEQTLYLMIISKLLLASKGISVLLGFDDCWFCWQVQKKMWATERIWHRLSQTNTKTNAISHGQHGPERYRETRRQAHSCQS